MIGLMIREAARTLRYRLSRPALERNALPSSPDDLHHLGMGLPDADVRRFAVRGPHGDHVVCVLVPPASPPRGGYPVIYVLDGNACAGAAADALALQARFAAHSCLEPPIVVTVGYPGREPIHLGRRAYDFLPPHASKRWRDRFMQGAPWHQPGGADAFLDFLAGPLRQGVARRYPINRSRQILCGHSFGGFFTLYALLTRPGAFQRYVALSPSLWWDDGRLMKARSALIAELPTDLAADVLIAVGGDETPGRPRISRRMIEDATEMARSLSEEAPAGLSCRYWQLEGENHQSVPLASLSAVLRFATCRRPASSPHSGSSRPAVGVAGRGEGAPP